MTTPKKDNLNALIFAPLPPPVGGVASITNMLNIGFQKYNDVLFKQPVTKGKLGIYRAASNLVRLIKAVCSIKSKGSVLLFSSAGFSFYEKLIWAKLILLLNRKAVLIMVDGNFPRFYQSLSVKYRRVISKQISHKNITIGAQSDTWLKYYKEIFPLANIEVVSASVDRTFMEVTRPSREKTSKIKLLYIG
ncbi:hypothetical protein, partial [Pedobacter sp. ASV12]|uniref:hypothetical protein n=1 Tax=Pedobacter sp. ASV12 TaxID=2795120 RepID=UPI0018EE130A